MTAHRFLSVFWRVRGKSLLHTLRLYAWFVVLIMEGIWVRLLPQNLRHSALKARWKRIFWRAQREKVYIRQLDGYYQLLNYFHWTSEGEFDLQWFQWQKGEVGMQIGANRGEYSFMASRIIGPEGLCIAIEPNPAAYMDLLELIVLNKAANVVALPVACGREEGWVELELPSQQLGDGVVRVRQGNSPEAPVIARVRMISADHIVGGLGLERVDFLIVDVEGYEGEVLRGAQETLRRFRPRLYIEIHGTWEEIETLLRAHAYTIRAWKGDRLGRGHIWAMPEAAV